MEELEPKNNPYLLGQDEAVSAFMEAYKNNSLHNSWLISGLAGIGKATFAYKIARFMLNGGKDADEGSQIFHLVASDAHPDMKVIERDYTETDKRKIIKAIKDGEPLSEGELRGLKKSTNIKVDEVRGINEFLSKKSANDGWRIVLADSVDDMNSASANAILKILEEPPHKTLMLLISHNPNRLLPTIKSRCRKLALKPLDENEVASLLRRYRSDVSEKDVKEIARLSGGSIGKAIAYADFGALGSYEDLCRIIYAKNNFKIEDLLNFCNKAVESDETYSLAKELVLKFITENAKSASDAAEFMLVWDRALEVFSETDGLNLDRKQALINVITNICKVI